MLQKFFNWLGITTENDEPLIAPIPFRAAYACLSCRLVWHGGNGGTCQICDQELEALSWRYRNQGERLAWKNWKDLPTDTKRAWQRSIRERTLARAVDLNKYRSRQQAAGLTKPAA